MVNNVSPSGFFTVPLKDDPQMALSKKLAKYERIPLLDQCQVKTQQYKKHYAGRLYA